MKFYYNDRLIRTSKSRHYKYAIMHGQDVLGLSETKINAEKKRASEFNRLDNYFRTGINREESVLGIINSIRMSHNQPTFTTIQEYRKYCEESLKSLGKDLVIVEVTEK